jgi:hypothetical protein
LYDEVSKSDNTIDNYIAARKISYLTGYAKGLMSGRSTAGKRFTKLHKILVNTHSTAQAKINDVQQSIDDTKSLLDEQSKQKNNRTRFIRLAYEGFKIGIFTKPKHWPETLDAFKVKPKAKP